MDGYLISVDYDEQTLRVHAKNKMARMALTGAKTTVVEHDDGSPHLQTRMGDNDLEIPRADITSATYKGANMMTNGNLTVVAGGAKYQLHFRKKQMPGFEKLAHDLGAI